jgi:hypothetical protein
MHFNEGLLTNVSMNMLLPSSSLLFVDPEDGGCIFL